MSDLIDPKKETDIYEMCLDSYNSFIGNAGSIISSICGPQAPVKIIKFELVEECVLYVVPKRVIGVDRSTEEVRLAQVPYNCKVLCDVHVKVRYRNNNASKEYLTYKMMKRDYPLFGIPVMAGSIVGKPQEEKGFFIDENGNEKAIISRLDRAENTLTVVRSKATRKTNSYQKIIFGTIKTVSDEDPGVNMWLEVDIIEEQIPEVLARDIDIVIKSPVWVKSGFNLFDVMLALGVSRDEDVIGMIAKNNRDKVILNKVRSHKRYKTVEEARAALSKDTGRGDLEKEWIVKFYSNQDTVVPKNKMTDHGSLFLSKARGFAWSISRMLDVYTKDRTETSDLDYEGFMNTRVSGPGALVELMLRDTVYDWVRNLRNHMRVSLMKLPYINEALLKAKIDEGFDRFVNSTEVEEEMNKYMRGRGNIDEKFSVRTDLVSPFIQELSRDSSRCGTLSHIRRVSYLNRNNLSQDIRNIQKGMIGRVDTIDTPESQDVGIVLNICLGVKVTKDKKGEMIKPVLKAVGEIEGFMWIYETGDMKKTTIIVNGTLWGTCDSKIDENTLYDLLKKHGVRRGYGVSVSKGRNNSYNIYCDSGRMLRPLVDLKSGGVLYYDHYEEEGLNIFDGIIGKNGEFSVKALLDKGYTHASSPLDNVSLSMSTIPLMNHCKPVRALHASGKTRQALSGSGTKENHFTIRYTGLFNDKPKVTTTTTHEIDGLRGRNVLVALMAAEGNNMEDGIVISEAAVNSGVFTGLSHRNFSYQEDFIDSSTMNRLVSGKWKGKGDRSMLDKNGVIRIGSEVLRNTTTVLIQAFKKEKLSTGKIEIKDDSVLSSPARYGKVTSVNVRVDPVTGLKTVNVQLTKRSLIQVGDKLCTRSGQKCTVCEIRPVSKMPYFEDIGAHPDILYNPHAFPTRETPNFIMEQAIDEVGTISDPFDPLPNLPKKPKFSSYKAYLPSGKECELFAGIIYFMRLKHLSSEKYHTRPPQYQGITGRYDPYDQVSKQPRAGKAQNGGMKIGEMERDAYVSSGKMQVSKYLMTDASDIQHYYVCSDPDCTYFIDAKKMGGLKGCPIEGCDGIMKRISIPYAIPLVCEHFRSIGNDLKFHLKQDTSNVIHEKN